MPKLFLVGFCLLLFCSMAGAKDYTDVTERTFTVTGTPDLVLRNSDGVVQVTAREGNEVSVKITRQVHGAKDDAHGKKEAERISLELEQIGNQVRAITRWPREVFSFGGGPSVTVHYEVHTPPKSNVRAVVSDGELYVNGMNGTFELDASDGRISAYDLSGDLRIRASDGQIDLKRSSGTMQLSISDGDLRAEDCKGTVQIRSGDGSVHLVRFDGEAEVSNGDGDVLIDGVLTTLNGRTGDGEMIIKVAPGSVMQADWSLSAGDGEIELDLPDDFSADLQITTGDGKVQTDHPIHVVGRLSSRHVSGKIGQGGHLLQIKTGDGHVAIQ